MFPTPTVSEKGSKSMLTRSERAEMIEELSKEFGEAKGIYLTGIERIDVEKMTQLRAEFRRNGVQYRVVKNTLARRALGECGCEGLQDYIQGATGVAFTTEEATSPAKIIKDFHKANKDLLKVKAAYIEGTVFDGDQADKLADIPSREVLLSQLLSCLQAPVSNVASALNGILTKLVGTLEAVRTKNESEQ